MKAFSFWIQGLNEDEKAWLFRQIAVTKGVAFGVELDSTELCGFVLSLGFVPDHDIPRLITATAKAFLKKWRARGAILVKITSADSDVAEPEFWIVTPQLTLERETANSWYQRTVEEMGWEET